MRCLVAGQSLQKGICSKEADELVQCVLQKRESRR